MRHAGYSNVPGTLQVPNCILVRFIYLFGFQRQEVGTMVEKAQRLSDAESGSGKRTVLVFGATGQQGGAVTAALKAKGWSVRALVRDPRSAKARALASAGVAVVPGDLADPVSIEAAMSGVYGVFSVQPSSGQGPAYGVTDEQEVRYGTTIANLALAHGVQHLVYTSVNAAGQGPTGMGHFDSKTQIEEHIRGLPLRSTIVRPAAFMELLTLPGMGLDQGVFTFFLRPDQSAQIIAADDIGKIVAGVFADPVRYAGRTIEIAGDQVTGIDLQKELTRAAGKPITYQRLPDSLLQENAFLGGLASLIDDGRLAGHADIASLRAEFGKLYHLSDWLAGPGKPLLDSATGVHGGEMSLR
ncbi:NmrA/HSCARG family protein [Lichenifustis flavocetrariae]|uniref:NmrA/HSCARG family protein n=1 Tax=Lichenifustis flavocetrariae TaxID=2949735 RepID=A0AA41YYZ1_9HYPH|nr:NmrA/HSCARG family protein [Lichenifustis flavocetrariae]MCW6507405.1 NmrA/HSCARG family protein [Lichenifustis flavocetrariae]